MASQDIVDDNVPGEDNHDDGWLEDPTVSTQHDACTSPGILHKQMSALEAACGWIFWSSFGISAK